GMRNAAPSYPGRVAEDIEPSASRSPDPCTSRQARPPASVTGLLPRASQVRCPVALLAQCGNDATRCTPIVVSGLLTELSSPDLQRPTHMFCLQLPDGGDSEAFTDG